MSEEGAKDPPAKRSWLKFRVVPGTRGEWLISTAFIVVAVGVSLFTNLMPGHFFPPSLKPGIVDLEGRDELLREMARVVGDSAYVPLVPSVRGDIVADRRFAVDFDWNAQDHDKRPEIATKVTTWREVRDALKAHVAAGIAVDRSREVWSLLGHGIPGHFRTDQDLCGARFAVPDLNVGELRIALGTIDSPVEKDASAGPVFASECLKLQYEERVALREILILVRDNLPDQGLLELAVCHSGEDDAGRQLGSALSRMLPGVRIALYQHVVAWSDSTLFISDDRTHVEIQAGVPDAPPKKPGIDGRARPTIYYTAPAPRPSVQQGSGG